MKHLLSIEDLSADEIRQLVALGAKMKAERGCHAEHPLRHQVWALMFSKSSTRTRVSFEVGIREMGGDVMFLSSADIQLGRGEPIKDTARVMGRMVHGAIIRTYGQEEVVEFAEYSGIPTINALTDLEHPCQILADLLTMQERVGGWDGKVVTFVGDGACNVPTSWVWAAARLGFELRIAAPKKFQPSQELLARANGNIKCYEDLAEAASGADVLYTDVWISMGKEAESAERLRELAGYQINNQILSYAKPGAIVMHCLPAYRGKEISEETLEAHADTIFSEAENRLHAQKAVLSTLAKSHRS